MIGNKMIKKTLKNAALVLLTVGASAVSIAADKIAVLDKNAAMFKSEAAQTINQQMQADYGDKEVAAKDLETAIIKIRQDYESDKDLLSESEIAALDKDIRQKQQELQSISQELQTINQSIQNQFVQQFQPILAKAVDTVIAKDKYTLVLDSQAVIFVKDSQNITEEVLVEFNRLVAEIRAQNTAEQK
jgi:outer membrane protein